MPISRIRVRRFASSRNDGGSYFFSIGGATFSAGAGGKAALAPSCCAAGAGCAGSGAGVVGRVPPGFDSAGVLDGSGEADGDGVACAVRSRCSARISVNDRAAITIPVTNRPVASIKSRRNVRLLFNEAITVTHSIVGDQRTETGTVPQGCAGGTSPQRLRA